MSLSTVIVAANAQLLRRLRLRNEDGTAPTFGRLRQGSATSRR
jgi:hypothetical protein